MSGVKGELETKGVNELSSAPYLHNTNFVVIGNSRVGKSAILSGFFHQECEFRPSVGEDVTKCLQEIKHKTIPNLSGYDVPGISDPDEQVRKRHEAMLISTLCKPGSYQFAFVTQLLSGGIVQAEIEMMQRILKALPLKDHEYGIVVNKVDKETMDYLEEYRDGSKSGIQVVAGKILEQLKPTTKYIHFQVHYELMTFSARGAQKIAKIPVELDAFLKDLPLVFVRPGEVGDIRSIADINLEDMKLQHEQKLKELEQHSKSVAPIEDHKRLQFSRSLAPKQQDIMEEVLRDVVEHQAKIAEQANWRHPDVVTFTTNLVVPLCCFAVYQFVQQCPREGKGDDIMELKGLIWALVLPMVLLLLGQAPALIGGDYRPMNVHFVELNLMARWFNLVLDFISLYEVCDNNAENPNRIKDFIVWSLAASISLEACACNLGFQEPALANIDKVQVVLENIIGFVTMEWLPLSIGIVKFAKEVVGSYV